MNKNDSEIMAGLMESVGYYEAEQPRDADLILLNTCSVREKAEEKVLGLLGVLGELKEENPDLIVGLAGCMAQRVKDEIFDRSKTVDFVIGPNTLHELPDVLMEVSGNRAKKVIRLQSTNSFVRSDLSKSRQGYGQAWVSVSFGCNKFCTYCIVPYVRGRERSRPMADLLTEIREIDEERFPEVVLLGQTVNSYGQDIGTTFSELLARVDNEPTVGRVRFLTSYPVDMTDDVIYAVRDLDKVCEYFHVPIQAGDDTILEEMRRGYTVDRYRKMVEEIRKIVPGCSISTDLIVGFPGETDAQYEATLKIVEELQLDMANTAAFSPRPGTPAAKMEGQLPESVKKERLKRLNEVVGTVAEGVNAPLLGTIQEVVVERVDVRKTEKQSGSGDDFVPVLLGRTRTNKTVRLQGRKPLLGKMASVRITKTSAWVLEGVLI